MNRRIQRLLSASTVVALIWVVAAIAAVGQAPSGKKKGDDKDRLKQKFKKKAFGKKKGASDRADAPPLRVGNLEAHLSDGSKLNVSLTGNSLKLHTAYGELVIPLRQIRGVRFATRTRPAVLQQIKRSISQLGSNQFRTRQDATIRLRAWGPIAYPILKQHIDTKDVEVQKRVRSLLDEIKGSKSPDSLKFRSQDEVQTENSTLSGQIRLDYIMVETYPFGRQKLLLTDIRSLKHRRLAEKVLPLLPDPGRLTRFQNQVGKSFRFHVTGSNRNTVWGSKVYTLDSPLATAAVHAGVVKPGQKGIVQVKIVPAQKSFKGSTKFGIRSHDYGAYPGGFQIKKDDP